MDDSATDTSVDAIRTWLTGRVAFYLERRPEQIDPDVPFVEIGLDSVFALTLCGDIEEQYDLAVDSTVPWDHPTVSTLGAHLAGELSVGR
jgi:acyl carrier protein